MAAVRKAAPKAEYTQQADTQHVVNPIAATNLLALDGKPRFAPQRIVFVCTTGGTVLLTPEKGVDFSLLLPVGVLVHDAPVKAIVSVTTAVGAAHIYWWDTYGSLEWNLEA